MLLIPKWQGVAGAAASATVGGKYETKCWSGETIIVTLTIKNQNEDKGVLYFLMGCFEEVV